ncbi:MAG: 4Fe-4S dicluster domain-containing protein [Candidatus Saganbacteria bacterium]|nr:4Fe-4S dicluster domain-containing protein [Candidatus Saganbacteria bacterium]
MEYFIDNANFIDFVKKLLETSRVLAPVEQYQRNCIQRITPDNIQAINLSDFRTVEPFKACFFALDEQVNDLPEPKPLTLLGARGCDLEALEVEDRVFGEGDFKDEFYLKRRENSFIIGADCTGCGKTCFCTMVGGQPFPVKLFDLNLSPVKGGYVVEVGSEKGKKLIGELPAATAEQLQAKAELRQRTLAALDETNLEYKCRCSVDWKDAHKANLENQKAWKEVTKNCVECSACNFICPTCTCFLLLDAPVDSQWSTVNSRHKVWDACLKNGYARVAGGANSRPLLYQRLQNRYHCKFDYSHDRLGRYTCVGCGRCIDACAGNIDMREVYAELVRQVPLTAKLE